MLKKILSNTIVRLILAVLIGLLVGLRGTIHRPLKKQRIQSLIIRF